MNTFTLVLLAALLTISNSAFARQEPTSPPSATPAPSGQPAPSTASPSSKGKNKPVPSYLIVGTVFDEKTLAFPGVKVRIRESGGKKFRWETYTNSRGEFAVRVPPGHEYEVFIHMKNYGDQNQSVDAKVDVLKRLSIKMQPRDQTKSGAKQ